ncbi:MAG: site-specific integrase [Pseudomonadota bacterium]
MLKAVLEGRTYETVGLEFGISRTAVERRIKSIAAKLNRQVGIDGLNEGSVAFVWRLRRHRESILAALEAFEPQCKSPIRPTRVVSEEELAQAVIRIRGRSTQSPRDIALFYTLFATGARPLEVARLQLGDYLQVDGTVRVASEFRAEVAITGKSRPLYFASSRLVQALDSYLLERLERRQGLASTPDFRGLDPKSRLFLTAAGDPFPITTYGELGQRRFLCRPILEIYRKLFRHAELAGATALSVRHTIVARLYDRGADEDQVGLMLGIADRSAVRELFPRKRPAMERLVHELV